MARYKKIREKRYTINRLINGFCYRTTLDCPWSAVLEAKRLAKLLGETVEYEFEGIREYSYTIA